MGEGEATPCFLDTCVYCGYVYDWDCNNGDCRRLFDSLGYARHTSVTVEGEIGGICRGLERFLKEVARIGLRQAIEQERNPNRRALFQEVAKTANKGGNLGLSELRLLVSALKKGFAEAMAKTCKPLAGCSTDYLLIQSFYFIGNKSDAQILGDAVEWSRRLPGAAVFFTKDSKDILDNSRRILEVISRNYGDAPKIEFRHVREC